ncbi:(Fe-S)-binding protein, partial [bacterium]|nr:(Fe-S)-binding protein [bacterium]
MKVALFIPCLTEHLFPSAALSMVKIFQKLGIDVKYIENQTCCGQPAFNTGYHKEVVPLAEHFIELFKNEEYIVAPSGSCVSMVREHYKDLPIREKLITSYQEICTKIYEFSEFLVDILKEIDFNGHFPHRVTYHDSCHVVRGLGIREQPRKLIQEIRDIDFIEMEKSDLCCGFGGTFSYKFKNISIEMVKRKCRYIEESKAEYCIGADSSCLMNIEGYL